MDAFLFPFQKVLTLVKFSLVCLDAGAFDEPILGGEALAGFVLEDEDALRLIGVFCLALTGGFLVSLSEESNKSSVKTSSTLIS